MHDENTRRFWVIHEEQARAIAKLGKDWDKQVSGAATVTFKNPTVETDSIFDISIMGPGIEQLVQEGYLAHVLKVHRRTPLEPPKPRPIIAKPSNNPWYRKFAK